jgi:hypothetical protein
MFAWNAICLPTRAIKQPGTAALGEITARERSDSHGEGCPSPSVGN